MLLVTLVLGVACLSSASAAEASGSLQDQLHQLQQEFQQKMDQMQMEIDELKSTNTVPKSGKQSTSQFLSILLKRQNSLRLTFPEIYPFGLTN